MTSLLYPSTINTPFTRSQLSALPTPKPMGRFHHPYPFAQYVDDIVHSLGQANISIHKEEYVTSHENQRLFGALEVSINTQQLQSQSQSLEGEYLPGTESNSQYKYIVGLRGAHDQSIQRGLCLGTQVMVCSNLCFSGNLGNLNTKQTTNIASRLPSLIRSAVEALPGYKAINEKRFALYKEARLNQNQVNYLLINLLRQNALSAPQVHKALKEWDKPKHDEHGQYGPSAWRFLNACTEALKPGGNNFNPHTLVDRSSQVISFMDKCLKITDRLELQNG